MAPASRRIRYARIALGIVDRCLEAGLSPAAVLTLMRIRLHPSKRTIPGLVRFGDAGLAESLHLGVPALRRHLHELQGGGALLVEAKHRLMYASGSVTDDPPRTTQAVIAMAREALELPDNSIVVNEIVKEIVHSLTADEKHKGLHQTWNEETTGLFHEGNRRVEGFTERSVNAQSTLTEPSSEIRDPNPINRDPNDRESHERALNENGLATLRTAIREAASKTQWPGARSRR